MKRTWLLAAVVTAGVLAGPAAAAPDPPQVRTLVLERTTSGPASFTFVVDAQLSDDEPQGFVGQVMARVERGQVTEAFGLANAYHWDYGVRANAGEQVVEVCQPLGGCIVNRVLLFQSWTHSEDEGGDDVFNRFYVVIEGPRKIQFTGDGWVLRERPLRYRWLGSADAEGSGVLTGTYGVQHFESASLPGGAGGSIGAGAPPCSQTRSSMAPRGLGTVTLTGGPKPLRMTCPINTGRPSLTGVAQGRTEWQLTGPVVGDNTMANVPLFVLDVPDRP